MEGVSVMESFVTNITSLIEPVKSAMAIFLEPPIVFFVAAAGLVVIFSLVKKLIPTKRR